MPTEYEAIAHETLRQGDIVLAPVALLAAAQRVDDDVPAAPRQLGVAVSSTLWRGGPGSAPLVAVEAQWCPVLVLSHDCELEKDFSERIGELMAGGMADAEAVEQASSDPSLDPFAVVAPLLAYAEFAAARHAAIRAGQRIGCLPVDALPGDGGDYVVDLFRPCTVSVDLLPQRAKVASLSQASVFELRYKISEAYSSRDLAVLVELEAMVGHRITAVEALPRSKKKTSLVLHLEGAPALHLDVRTPREELPREITRAPRPQP